MSDKTEWQYCSDIKLSGPKDSIKLADVLLGWRRLALRRKERIEELEAELAALKDDGWKELAREYLSNGNCPVCFGDDEGGHKAGCDWGDAEADRDRFKVALEDAEDVLDHGIGQTGKAMEVYKIIDAALLGDGNDKEGKISPCGGCSPESTSDYADCETCQHKPTRTKESK